MRPRPGPFPIRTQTAADLEAARFDLLAWHNPWDEGGPSSPFWDRSVSSRHAGRAIGRGFYYGACDHDGEMLMCDLDS